MFLKRTGTIFFIVAVALCASYLKTLGQTVSGSDNASSSKTDLQSKIQEKTQELQNINSLLQEAQKKLSQTQSERQTLQKQVSFYQNTIGQLNLSIQQDSVSAQKLNFEVDSLGYDLKDIQTSVEDKKAAVDQLLLNMQKNDNENSNLLALFLKNKTLADGIMETQSLSNMRAQLSLDIKSLADLGEEYNSKIKEKSSKISDIKFHLDNLSAKKTIVASQKEEQQAILTATKNKESVYQNQLSEIQKLQDKVEAEIEMMDLELRKNIDPDLLPPTGPDVLLDPVPKGNLSQGYGTTNFALKTYRGKWHNGADIAAPVGTEMYAAEGGTVINVGNQDRFCPKAAYGKFVEIKHNNGLTTLYGHMSLQVVSIGQKVTRGQLIGYVGKTGWATGPHVHFTVFATQTITPARPGYPEGTKPSTCGPMPVGGDLNPLLYTTIK